MKSRTIGRIGQLRLSADLTVAVSLIGLWLILALSATTWLGLSPATAWPLAAVAAVGHTLLEIWHQLGHAIAAQRTGYPMTGIRLWGPLGRSIYPKDEPKLPPRIHIERALGGPLASLLLTFILSFGLLFIPAGGGGWYLLLFLLLDNLLLFTLGAFVPLGFTDGSTLLNAWQQANSDH